MPVDLPLEPATWPHFRIAYRASWGAGATGASGGGWTLMPMQSPAPDASGMILESYGRALLPQLGTARLLFRYGRFGSRLIGAGASSTKPIQQGGAWDPADALTAIPDLTGKEILIQVARRFTGEEAADSLVWSTVWWGTCEYQTDEGWGGADIPAGQRTYHCIEALQRLKHWPANVHGFLGGGVTIAPARGHPGYNTGEDSGRVSGNRNAGAGTFETQSKALALLHSLPAAGVEWSDEQAINHLLATSRPAGEPLWTLSGATTLFTSASSWPVAHGESAWDVLNRIVDRARGRGAVRCEWTQASPLGSITPILKAYAQINDTISYDEPGGSQVTINGATTNGTAVEVDVIGDHRFVADSLLFGDAEQYQVGYLESEGEPIEVLATLSYGDGSLEIGWKASQETAFRALDQENRTEAKWLDVLQQHRLERGFFCMVGDGNGGTQSRCDYRCDDAGAIITPTTEVDTSPGMIRVLDDLPIFVGYNYEATPVRYDGDAGTTNGGEPARHGARVFIKAEDNRYLDLSEQGVGFSLQLVSDGFILRISGDQENGTRYFDAGTAGNLNSSYHYNTLVLTVGIRLPHRIRMATGDPTAKRRKTITHAGLHLWMAHPGAIWDLDSSTREVGDASPPKRAASASTSPTAGVLRDDRAALARRHVLAVEWYGPLTNLLGQQMEGPARRSCSWSLRCCGDIATAEDYDGGDVVYPTVGQVVTYINANGQRIRLMTPVSSFVYDNVTGISTWTTDWQDLDFR